MTWTIVILSLGIIFGIYKYGKKRGRVEVIREELDTRKEDDIKHANEVLEDKRDDNAWDNLNDTLDRARKRNTD